MTGKGGFGGSALSRRVAPETMTSRACGRVVLAIQDSNKHDCHDDGVAEGEGSVMIFVIGEFSESSTLLHAPKPTT